MADEQFIDDLYNGVDDIFAKDKKAIADKNKEEIEDLVMSMKDTLRTRGGRKILWWIMSRGNLFASIYSGRALDQAYAEGLRTLAAEAFSLAMKADPHILQKMTNERLMKEE